MRNTCLQLLQLITGALIAILLGIHMIIMHLDAVLGFFGVHIAESTSWESMIERARQGLWTGIYIALLVFALYHALNGLRGIILELTPSRSSERIITGVIIMFGIIFLILGTVVPIALLSA